MPNGDVLTELTGRKSVRMVSDGTIRWRHDSQNHKPALDAIERWRTGSRLLDGRAPTPSLLEAVSRSNMVPGSIIRVNTDHLIKWCYISLSPLL